MRVAARARLTAGTVLNQLIAAELDEAADLTTEAVPISEDILPLISHDAELLSLPTRSDS